MRRIVPAILVESAKQFEKQLRLVEQDCDLIQVDILDGTLFENTNWHDPVHIGALRTDVKMEIHLMVENPLPIIEAWKEHVPTFERAIVHAEIHRPLAAVVERIQQLGLKAGVALNPESPLSEAEDVLHVIDSLTIMSVYPGFQRQSFGKTIHMDSPEAIFEKIRTAREHREDLIIEIDGGVTEERIPQLLEAGVNHFGIGSRIFGSENPTEQLKQLNDLVRNNA